MPYPRAQIAFRDKLRELGWKNAVIKPCISGAARHTYRIDDKSAAGVEATALPAERVAPALERRLDQHLHRHQRIPQFVGQTGGQLADAGELLASQDLRLPLLEPLDHLGDVLGPVGCGEQRLGPRREVGDRRVVEDLANTSTDGGAARFTGEHGVGIEKVNSMCVQFSAAENEQMFGVKRAFDPSGLLNPGKVIPTLQRCAEYGKMLVRGGQMSHPELPRF